jgi:hypothetical protein
MFFYKGAVYLMWKNNEHGLTSRGETKEAQTWKFLTLMGTLSTESHRTVHMGREERTRSQEELISKHTDTECRDSSEKRRG